MGKCNFLLQRCALSLIAVGAAAAASAGGGHGGGGGDSSMNPYTGDSYAYFHCGHNLGEQGFNIPWRVPAGTGGVPSRPTATGQAAQAPTNQPCAPATPPQQLGQSERQRASDPGPRASR